MLQSPRHPVPPLLQSQKRTGTPLPLPLPHATAARWELVAAQAQHTALTAGSLPASVCACLAATEPEAGSARSRGCARRQGRQGKHRDPGETDRAAAVRTPTRK